MNIFTDGLSTGVESFSFENYNDDGFWDSIEQVVAVTAYGTGESTSGISISSIEYGFENYNLIEYWLTQNNQAFASAVIIREIIAAYEIDYDVSVLNTSDMQIDAYVFDPYTIDVQRDEVTEHQFNIGLSDFDYLPSTITAN